MGRPKYVPDKNSLRVVTRGSRQGTPAPVAERPSLGIDDGNLNYVAQELAPWLRAWFAGHPGFSGVSTAADWLEKLVAEVRCLRKRHPSPKE